jgi:hypothetical protein
MESAASREFIDPAESPTLDEATCCTNKPPMTRQILQSALAATALIGWMATPAQAQNPGFNFGDLIMGFQTTGSGSGSYVLANLGQAGTIRDAATNQTLLSGNTLQTVLNSQFGLEWFNRNDLYVGIFTVGNNDEFSGFFVNGDPYNTLYVGAPRQSVGEAGSPASGGFLLTGQAVQDAANGMFAAANIFEQAGTGAISTISATRSLVDYDNENPISGGVQGASWGGVFAGGTQAVFGPGVFGNLGGTAAEAALDLYRIQGVNDQAGQFGFGQPTGQSTYEGTIMIDNAGQVSLLVVPEPSVVGLLAVASGILGMTRRRRTTQQ